MLCKKCKKEIESDSVYCRFCGSKQTREKNKTLKRANGTGSVKRLTGRRKKPWVALISKGGKQIPIGYFDKRTDALNALNAVSPDSISERYNQTIEDIYNDWKALHFKGLSRNGEQGYKTAWAYFESVKDIKMRDAKTDTFQACVKAATEKGHTRAVCEKIKHLASQLCKFAMQSDLINKNYAQFLILPKPTSKEKEIFTDEEIALLKQHDYDERAKIVLSLIYSGFRIDELLSLETKNVFIDDRYMVGGIKTEAGKDRIVPISDEIYSYIKQWYNESIMDKTKLIIPNNNGKKRDAMNFRKREFYPILEELGIQHHVDKEHPARLTPHCCRHTFASLAVKAGMKPEVLQAIMGHADYSTTADVYVHQNIAELINGMHKIDRLGTGKEQTVK